MSAWFKWKFPTHLIKDINVLNNQLYILMDTNKITKIDLSDKVISGSFLDLGTESYEAKVQLSRFNVQTRSDSKMFREPMYYKSVMLRKEGSLDLEISNQERIAPWIVKDKHLSRKIAVGGNSNTTDIIFKSTYDTGCKLDTISLEGIIKTRSRNV